MASIDNRPHPNLPYASEVSTTTGNVQSSNSTRASEPAGERRSEERYPVSLVVQIWGRNAAGDEFVENTVVRDLSARGALLVDVHQALRCGDLIGVSLGGRRARFRVVWTREIGPRMTSNAAIQRLESDSCPWSDTLALLKNVP